MNEEANLLLTLIDEMSVELDCTAQVCDSGGEGAPWKSPPLTEAIAIQMLDHQIAGVHGQHFGGVVVLVTLLMVGGKVRS